MLAACAHGPELKLAPKADAPVEKRLVAHQKMRPKTIAVSGDEDDQDARRNVEFMILGSGARVDDVGDLRKVLGDDSEIEARIDEAESKREAWWIYRTVASVALGLTVVLTWTPITDWIREGEDDGPKILKVVGALGALILADFLVELPGKLLFEKPAARARSESFFLYHEALHTRLGLCTNTERDDVTPCEARTSTAAP